MGTKDGGKKPNPNDLNSFKGFFYYMIIILVMTVLLNGLVFPSALKSQVKEVGYNEFLAMVDNNSAPAFTRILESQVPLKPVCPVTRTFFPL